MTKPIRVLHISTHDHSGAGRSALRLHLGLLEQGVASEFLVSDATTDTPRMVQPTGLRGYYKRPINRFLLQSEEKALIKPNGNFSENQRPSMMVSMVRDLQPDIINLHWIGWDFLQIEDLRAFQKPLVWTFHDSWAYTGGCHITYECERFQESCGSCPLLVHSGPYDLSHRIWKRKQRAWRDLDLHIVSPSRWLAECSRSSALFRETPTHVIPYGLDPKKFKPLDKKFAREILGLPQDKKLVLFGAMNSTADRRKGFHLLQPALLKLSQEAQDLGIEVVVFGASRPETPPDFGFPVTYVGSLRDDTSLALIYSACDVFVAPSIVDNLPNTVLEAIACGSPCVAFDIGGMPDMITHQANGYLAQPFETDELAYGIRWVLEDETRRQALGAESRRAFEARFLPHHQANAYQTLYAELLAR